jgi:outer membrane protein assembly factor BamB
MKKPKFSTIALILVLTFSALFVVIPINAHDPPLQITTYAYLAISPNPVGVGQSVFLLMWLHGAPPTAAGVGGDRYTDFTIEVIGPSGPETTLGPFTSDPTGSFFTTYTPTQIGDYTFVFNYPGQVLSLNNPVTGVPGSASPFIGDTFLPSTTTAYLTVQQDPIEKIPDYPPPSEYWTRPIEGQNTAWASLGSHWLGGAQIGYVYGGSQNLFQKDGTAPKSSHIMWTMPTQFGGVVGGTTGIPEATFYSGGSYEGRFTYALSMYGMLYFTLPLNHAGGSRASGAEYVCLDMRTGETEWASDVIGIPYTGVFGSADRPTLKGQLYGYESFNQHGVIGGVIWQEADMGSTWIAYDAYTGQWLYNFTNVPSGTEVYTDAGEIERYVLNYNRRWLALWTSAALPDSPLVLTPGTTTNAYQFRPMGKIANMSENYRWNVTIPDLPGLSNPSIVTVIPGDLILGTSSSFPMLGGILSLTEDPITMWAISDKPETRGQLLWIKDYPAPPNMLTPTLGPVDEDTRVFTMSDVQTFQWYGYDLDTGNLLWGPSGKDFRAFQYYGGGEGGGQKGFVAYGNLYVQSYGGEIHCYDMANGNLLWKYDNTNSGVETVWGNYPIFIMAIADGKVYVFNNEHSPNTPLYKGEKVRCIDAYTGEELWSMLGWAGQTGGRGQSTGVLADGFLCYFNYYDNQIYCIGKAASATTVTTQNDIFTQGNSVLIKGTVTDLAPGTKQDELAARFPNGVPAIADEYMDEWMEYLYMQKPCPMMINGVEVKLETLDPNGNFYEIGRTTSDTSGFYSLMWEPPVPGKYTIIATFEGSDSYWRSFSETAIGVTEAPSPSGPIEPEPIQPAEAPLISIEVAIIIAVAVVIGIVAFWTLRKRK